MKPYEIMRLRDDDQVVVLGRKTYFRYDGNTDINLLTRVLNDGWKIEHFAVTEVRITGGDAWSQYHFVMSKDSQDP